MKYQFATPSDRLQKAFLESFVCDLKAMKHEVSYRKKSTHHEVLFTPFDTSRLTDKEYKEHFKDIYKGLKEKIWQRNKEFIFRIENKIHDTLLAHGQLINPNNINPKVYPCKTRSDFELQRYCRYYQGLTESGGVGRRLSALVYDEGQRGVSNDKILMGVIGLSSAGYAQASRDKYLEWTEIDSKEEKKQRRCIGLRHIMQLSVCIALPPYNILLGGKLLALLAFTNPLQESFKARYKKFGNPFLAIVTTAAYGSHAALYNRIQLTKISGETPFTKTELFTHIGNTLGYTTALVSDETVHAAEELVRKSSKASKNRRSMHSDTGRANIISKAISLCGISRDVLVLNPKGIMIGALDEQNIKALKTGIYDYDNVLTDLSVDRACEYWKNHWLNKVISRTEKISRFREHRVSSMLLGPNL